MGVLGWGEERDLLVWSPKTGGSLLCSHQLCKLGWVCKFFWLPLSSFVRQDQVISYPTEPWWVAHGIAHVWYLAFCLEHNKLPRQVYFFLKISWIHPLCSATTSVPAIIFSAFLWLRTLQLEWAFSILFRYILCVCTVICFHLRIMMTVDLLSLFFVLPPYTMMRSLRQGQCLIHFEWQPQYIVDSKTVC